jgi:hypothetical protein
MGRGRKPKDSADSKLLIGMALLLEGGQARTVRDAAIKVVRHYRVDPGVIKLESLIDRLRKRFKKLEPELRAKARQLIADRNKPVPLERPPSAPITSWYPGKKLG